MVRVVERGVGEGWEGWEGLGRGVLFATLGERDFGFGVECEADTFFLGLGAWFCFFFGRGTKS